jgi:rubrerythrin
MTKFCLDDNCYNLTKQLVKKLEFLSHAKMYLEDASRCDSEGSERVWKTIISDEERHAELLKNQLQSELKK